MTSPVFSKTSTSWQKSPALPQLAEGELHIWVATFLSSAELAEKKNDFMKGILARYLQLPLSQIVLEHSPLGKPQLTAEHRALYFNLSHSQNYICLVLATCEVGIDIQCVKPISHIDRFEQRICHLYEREQIKRIPNELRLRSLFELWSRKESALKALGEGIRRNLFEVSTLENPIYLRRLTENDTLGVYWQDFKIYENSVGCVSSLRPIREVRFFSTEE